MKVSLDHINISVRNFEKAVEFYEKVFGFKQVENGKYGPRQRWAILRAGDIMMSLNESDKEEPTEDVLKVNHFAIRVDDENPVLKNLDRIGIKIKPEDIWECPHSKSWYVKDPSGHGIEIVKWNNDEIRFS